MYNRKEFKEKLFRERIFFLDLNLKVWSGRHGMFPGQKDNMRAVACGPDSACGLSVGIGCSVLLAPSSFWECRMGPCPPCWAAARTGHREQPIGSSGRRSLMV